MSCSRSSNKCDRCGKFMEHRFGFFRFIRGLWKLNTPSISQIFYIDDEQWLNLPNHNLNNYEKIEKASIIITDNICNEKLITLCSECRRDFKMFMKNK